MELQGKRAAVLVEQMYQELEVWYPIYRLKEAGCKVTVIGPEAGQTYPSKLGYPVKTDRAARDVSADDFDLLIIPGGYAPDHMRRCPAMIKLVSTMAEQGKPVAAICHGPWMLCSTQALKGRKATCFSAIKDDIINAGATYIDGEVVRDGNLITSRKPDDLPAFMQAIIQAVKEMKPARAEPDGEIFPARSASEGELAGASGWEDVFRSPEAEQRARLFDHFSDPHE